MATDETGIARDRMLIASTHTHSAPSAMSYCLGSRVDEKYATWLPPRLAKAIIDADARRRPAEIGYTIADAPEHTNCRRWIRRPDRVDTDPFGERTVRAMMHPGHRNPDFIGPSGPVDTGLSLVSVRGVDGRPIAVLGNYSMHYFGVGGGLSPDFCGLFARRIAARFAPAARASAFRSSAPLTGTTATTWRPSSSSATRVLPTVSGSRPSAATRAAP